MIVHQHWIVINYDVHKLLENQIYCELTDAILGCPPQEKAPNCQSKAEEK